MRSCLTALGLRAGPQPPGTEFLDAETKRQESSFKRANAGRDQNPGKEWPEIPAETPYLASSRKSVVCGDWMVVCAVRYEPVSEGKIAITGKNTGKNANICHKLATKIAKTKHP